MSSNFENIVVQKPWGEEYLLYENDKVALWHLLIKENQCTSLHAHPNKKSGLIICSGAATVSFLSGENRLLPGEKILIRQGVFHRTTANVGDVQLLEIETPNNKLDLVRLEDNYGRKGKPYENQTQYIHRKIKKWKPFQYKKIGNFEINYTTISSSLNLKDKKRILRAYNLFMILSGQIICGNFPVAGPGDILYRNSLKLLLEKFSIPSNTKLELLTI